MNDFSKTNAQLDRDVSTLLGGTAGIFGSYVQTANIYAVDGSLFWVAADASVYYIDTTGKA